MPPPAKDQPRGAGEQPGGRRARPPRQSWRVLAQRSQSVAPVGIWVESGPEQPQDSLAFASACQVEEELRERQRQRAARLRRFQGEVRRRLRVPRRQQLQKSCEALSKTLKQVRRRLASCKTVLQGAPELPGGIWRREEPEARRTAAVAAGDGSEEILLAGHHDLPAELQGQGTAPQRAEQGGDFYIKIEFEKFRDRPAKGWRPPEPPQRPHAAPRAALGAAAEREEARKQRQGEYLQYRRLFMDIEREQVREQQRQKERQKRAAQIKSKKEKQRRAEERRMREGAARQGPPPGEGASETLAQLELLERREKMIEEKQRNKEQARYLEALRAQMREKIKLLNIDLPPLCSCGPDFWDSHPDTCANNCVFYKNHKAHSRALQSLVSSCRPTDTSPSARAPLRHLAALCARWGRPL
uniref:Coiled-coil domain containing 15 n=1 Tax=Otus sunia TaxID=257818 RepID=A0A8C8BIN9_9STRI